MNTKDFRIRERKFNRKMSSVEQLFIFLKKRTLDLAKEESVPCKHLEGICWIHLFSCAAEEGSTVFVYPLLYFPFALLFSFLFGCLFVSLSGRFFLLFIFLFWSLYFIFIFASPLLFYLYILRFISFFLSLFMCLFTHLFRHSDSLLFVTEMWNKEIEERNRSNW